MRTLLGLAAAAVAALVFVQAAAPAAPAHSVAIFYYPWYGTPAQDGSYEHWSQNGHTPPGDLYSAFYPALGAYSSTNQRVLGRQMAEIATAGVDEVIASWWGRGSKTDLRLTAVLRAARRRGLAVAAHIEPYGGRTPETVAADVTYLSGLGIGDVYVYRAEDDPAAAWAAVRGSMPPVRLFAQTAHVGFAAAAAFDGIYTYDILTYDGDKFVRLCDQARRLRLLCAPSVGPGYDATRAGEVAALKSRRAGATYDAMWTAALDAQPDLVTITSYNEWGEGTQIEPARTARGYRNYDGAWGLRGPAASSAYLARTAYWAARFHDLR